MIFRTWNQKGPGELGIVQISQVTATHLLTTLLLSRYMLLGQIIPYRLRHHFISFFVPVAVGAEIELFVLARFAFERGG